MNLIKFKLPGFIKIKSNKILLFLFLMVLLFFFFACTSPQNTNSGNLTQNNSSSLTVNDSDTVTVEYKGYLDNGLMFDSSDKSGLLTFTLGKHEVIVGFEEAVKGMQLNEEKTVVIPVDKAYGSHKKELVVELPKESFKDASNLKIGTLVQGSNGEKGVIIEVKDKTVIVDFNHPLAGKNLKFWIKVVDIQKH